MITDQDLEKINKIYWNISTPLSEACLGFDDSDNPIPISADIWDIPLNIRKGDKVLLGYYRAEPTITSPITGNTLHHLFLSIEKGMKDLFELSDAPNVYKHIGTWYHTDDRRRLADKFERGELMKKELCQEDVFFEGNLNRRPDGIWVYSTNFNY
jgi:hypothetical protein